MRKRTLLMLLLVLAVSGLLAGCGGAPAPGTVAADEVPVVPEDGVGTVVAEAVIEPARWSELRFHASDEVAEVLVEEGQQVRAGDPLVRLEAEELALQVDRAEASLSAAEAELARMLALPRREEVVAAEANLRQVEVMLQQAQAAYDRVSWRPEISMLPQSLALQQATLEYEYALANYNLARRGASEEEIAIAEASVAQAQIALEEAELRLEQATLTAPIAGTVTKVNVEAGERVTSGEVILVLATLDQLQARTLDLTELDVARVAVGQPAVVTVDALPDLQLTGRVIGIGLQSEDYRGDVTYPVTVELDEAAPGLRWGMTAVVEIDVE